MSLCCFSGRNTCVCALLCEGINLACLGCSRLAACVRWGWSARRTEFTWKSHPSFSNPLTLCERDFQLEKEDVPRKTKACALSPYPSGLLHSIKTFQKCLIFSPVQWFVRCTEIIGSYSHPRSRCRGSSSTSMEKMCAFNSVQPMCSESCTSGATAAFLGDHCKSVPELITAVSF